MKRSAALTVLASKCPGRVARQYDVFGAPPAKWAESASTKKFGTEVLYRPFGPTAGSQINAPSGGELCLQHALVASGEPRLPAKQAERCLEVLERFFCSLFCWLAQSWDC